MRNLFLIICIILTWSITLTSCKKSPLNGTKKVVGVWNNEISRKMGGFIISKKTKLTITRNGPGDYNYELFETVVDQMYGSQQKQEYSIGKLDSVAYGDKWNFISGEYHERGGYILVPTDKWEELSPNEIIVKFNEGSGFPITFNR